MRRTITIALIVILTASSMVMVQAASAQSIPVPSAPEFTVRYVDRSYDEPAVYETDPYTGKTVMTQAGYHVQNCSVEVIIKNQPYTSYRNENGSLTWLYYSIAMKGHYENWDRDQWVSGSVRIKDYDSCPAGYFPSEDSEYTVITYGLPGDNGEDAAYKYLAGTYNAPPFYGYYNHIIEGISLGGEVDFRVQAIVGYSTRINETQVPGIPVYDPTDPNPRYYIFTGQASEWSEVKTVKIGDTTVTAIPLDDSYASSLDPTPTAIQTLTPLDNNSQSGVVFSLSLEQVVIAVMAVAVAVLAMGMAAMWRKMAAK